jgi:SAM-dependent methyltransferase
LDVGCGSGRDLLWFKKQGLLVTGFERSPGLAALARKHAGCEVIEGDFETFDFASLAVDALLLCGSLVHVPHRRLAAVLENIAAALKGQGAERGDAGRPGAAGLLYISLKEGRGQAVDTRGRVFYLWRDADLRKVFAAAGLEVVEALRSPSADGEGKIWLAYVLADGRTLPAAFNKR